MLPNLISLLKTKLELLTFHIQCIQTFSVCLSHPSCLELHSVEFRAAFADFIHFHLAILPSSLPAPDSPLFCTSSLLTCTPQSPVRIISSVRDSFSSLLKYKSQDGTAWFPKKMGDHTPNRIKMSYQSPHHKPHNCSCFGGPFWLNCKMTTIWIACSDWTIATDALSLTQKNVVTGLEHLALEHLAWGNFSTLLIKEMYQNDEGSCRNRGEQESQTKVQTGLCLQLDKKSMEIKNRRRKMWKKMVQAKLEYISLRKKIIKRREKR